MSILMARVAEHFILNELEILKKHSRLARALVSVFQCAPSPSEQATPRLYRQGKKKSNLGPQSNMEWRCLPS